MRRRLEWTLTPDASAPGSRTVPAQVPGNVQIDWARAEGWDERWWHADEFRRYRWMEDVGWTYRAELPEGKWVFHASSLDYSGAIRVDGVELARFEGANTPVRFVLPPGRSLEIAFDPAPTLPDDRQQRKLNRRTTKPGVFYGWDFAPRLVPLGIADELWLEPAESAHTVEWQCRILPDLSGEIEARLEFNLPLAEDLALQATLYGPEGEIELHLAGPEQVLTAGSREATLSLFIPRPELWWPNGEGPQNLYRLELDAGGVQHVRKFGFRTIRLVPYKGSWNRDLGWPKTQNDPPITLEVNGRRIFGQGANWVPPSMFPGTDDAETYRPLLEAAKASHFNLLRIWGGGGAPKEAFFDLCDELGLLVWQEFPLACAQYSDDGDYLALLAREAEAIVRRLRSRASLAIWCGGNELFNSWSRNTEQSLAIRKLNAVCLDLDPATPFLMTSPVMAMGHGNYTFRDEHGREPHQVFAQAENTAYTEFGCGGPPDAGAIRAILPDSELWPPREGTGWQWHNGLKAWDGNPGSWLCPDILRHYFGEPRDLEELVAQGQLLQTEGMRFIYEEARRQQPRCSIALAWCFNEPWPTAANNSLVAWPCQPKPALEAVRDALTPVMASLRAPRFAWSPGESFTFQLFAHNATGEAQRLEIEWEVLGSSGSWTAEVAPRSPLPGPTESIPLPPDLPGRFDVVLRWGEVVKRYPFLRAR